MPEQASEDAETEAAVPSKDERDPTIAYGDVREFTDSSSNVEDRRQTPLLGMPRIRMESDGGQVTEVLDIEAASS